MPCEKGEQNSLTYSHSNLWETKLSVFFLRSFIDCLVSAFKLFEIVLWATHFLVSGYQLENCLESILHVP